MLQFRSGYRATTGYTGAGTLACLVGRRVLVVAAALAFFAGAGQARAAIGLSPCPGKSGVECGTVTVPLDRTGATGGTINLHVEVLPAAGTARGVMFLIAGGPGQGSAGSFDLGPGFNRELMQFMFPGYTLVAFDNRGTGQSGLIDCPALQRATSGTAEQFAGLAAACATIIGPQRVFYSTRDHADDMDAVRAALGVDKIGLYGVSYGTKLALAYALGYPTHVERIALDSVVPTDDPDPFDQNVLQEMPGTLQRFCADRVCRGATPNYAGEVVTLANRIEAKPLRGRIIGANGRAKTMTMNGEAFLNMMIDADLTFGLAAEAPAAVHAALHGNPRPLLRIYDFDLSSNELTAQDLSFGLNAATNCADGRFPWGPTTPPASRRAAIDSAVANLPAGALGPFGNWAAKIGTAYFCEQWPSPAGNTPLGPGPLPDVPMIAIDGGFDLRTPVQNAIDVQTRFPHGKLLVVRGVGHSVTGADASGCSQNYVRQWILGTLNAPDQAECAQRVQPVAKVLKTFPKRPARITAATLATVGKTLREAEATFWFNFSTPVRGLFGGKLTPARSGLSFTLARYSLAPGVLVSGKLSFVDLGPPSTFKGTVKVSGSAAVAGTLKVAKTGRITGSLGGRKVSARY
ncbi:MAG: alpha/beta hydrolase [Actinobacteria bacterium]|nr:MAG: alpha/beta hydrolase [Actinomycetota bacterium]